jgi:SpoVK/Ycf46/Vps4 family AAA+-type ATPase
MSEAIDLSSYIIERTRNFSGRAWVFRAISEWVANPRQRRYFLLTGTPGSGKTAISARLAQFLHWTEFPARWVEARSTMAERRSFLLGSGPPLD